MTTLFLKVSRENTLFDLQTAQKLKAAHPGNHFPRFLDKLLQIARPVNYPYLPPCFRRF